MNGRDATDAVLIVERAFKENQISPSDISVRRFPGETIVIVEVMPSDFASAVELASQIDNTIPDGFITVRKAATGLDRARSVRVQSLLDPRVNDIIEILNARSRTSEHQPSLHYIPDAAQSLSIAISRRHHLVFGRRGVGKTTLLLEAKKSVEAKGANTFWMNIQTMRSLSAYEAFLSTASRLCDLPDSIHLNRVRKPLSVERAALLKERVSKLLGGVSVQTHQVDLLLPDLQALFQILGQETQSDLYIFLDDFHYLSMAQQPRFLDLIHSISRDTPTWIKAAGIRHQSRWFSDNPPVGLQTGHDAATINLDITLEQPAKAKAFLSNILETYVREVNVSSIFDTISKSAIDRLVLASGGVPRDFMVLGSLAIQVARERSNAKNARVQDVNEAAGRNAQPKLQELEDDAASSIGSANARNGALTTLRTFLLEERQTTYFRVDFRDKETHQREYDLLQSLMDLRIIHLINSSVSDERLAGHRSEVYMLDLSQYANSRLKRSLKVLDFQNDHLVLKSTGKGSNVRPGDTPNKLLGILRRGPALDLSTLSPFIALASGETLQRS